MQDAQDIACREWQICRCPASCPRKPTWLNITARNAATMSVHHESPTTTKAAQLAARAAPVKVVFQM